MKKIILLVACAAFFVQSKAQVVEVKEVPGVVVTSFQNSYPTVNTVEWRRAGGNYEAVYNENQNETYVIYNPTGKLIETGEGIEYSVAPAATTTYVKTKYKGDKMTKIYKIKDANGKTTYKGRVKTDKGEDSYLLFDENGNFVKEVKY